MEFLKLKFWLNLALAMATFYIIIRYIFTPSNNQCQMTFMMEPPKFIPVPIKSAAADKTFLYPEAPIIGSPKINSDYKLYMYSEYGFPQATDMRRDLKDSMPVLFVPGNAGSYQQVRSLASTCIRQQLRSLEAFKFIFYTIDFGGQLSGVSGKLIEEQTDFVHDSLNTIAQNHPTETNGIILIGHSVGGFISKVLFSKPDFSPSSVPLLISLASPLIRPYLTFEEKMRELYVKTNEFWSKNQINETISISISGGQSDRLVPMHLSIDPNFDISLTTSSMKDVWLPTDHVCITWCRELMHKLAHLLSALMDKKHTRLISDKNDAIYIVKNEFLIDEQGFSEKESKTVINKDWKSLRPYKLTEFCDFFSTHRSELGDSITILNLTNSKAVDLLINIEHIEALKEKELFGCHSLDLTSNDQLICIQRIDVIHLSFSIPSRRFEPKRTALKLKRSEINHINYLALNFIRSHSDTTKNGSPESITIQELDDSAEQTLYIPTLIEFAYKKLLMINNFAHKIISPKSHPFSYVKCHIENLKQTTQVYTMNFKSHNCRSGNHPSLATVSFFQDGHFYENSFPVVKDKNSLEVTLRISPKKSIHYNQNKLEIRDKEPYLEIYLDGTCDNYLHIQLDFIGLVIDIIQKSLGKILTSATYVSYLSSITLTFDLVSQQQGEKHKPVRWNCIEIPLGLAGFILVYLTSGYMSLESSLLVDGEMVDELIVFVVILTLSYGLVAFFGHLLRRIIDLALIVNNAQSLIRRKLNLVTSQDDSSQKVNGSSPAQSNISPINKKYLNTDFDMILMAIAVGGSFIFSAALMSVFTLFLVIKLNLRIELASGQSAIGCCTINKHCHRNSKDEPGKLTRAVIQDLTLNIAVLCTLSLLSNIPIALVTLHSNRLGTLFSTSDPTYSDINFIASGLSLILVKIISSLIEANFIANPSAADDLIANKKRETLEAANSLWVHFLCLLPHRLMHLLCLFPIMLIESNMCHVISAATMVFLWLSVFLQSHSHTMVSKNTTQKRGAN